MAGLRGKGAWVPDNVEGMEGKGDFFALGLGQKIYYSSCERPQVIQELESDESLDMLSVRYQLHRSHTPVWQILLPELGIISAVKFS